MAHVTGTMAEKEIRQLNSLLRGEISAVETYDIALKKLDDTTTAEATQLRAIAQEHGEAAQTLREHIREIGGNPETSSGAWGAFAKSVSSVASIFGDSSALKSLKEGEEHGLKDYQRAMRDLDPECAGLLTERFIPANQRHIATLDSLIDRVQMR